MGKVCISIIIPVYNNEKFLKKCLDSIVLQTFEDFEVIIVDDGSMDGSSKICQKFVEYDSRFVYIRKNNEGVSSARNTGLLKAKGLYITFIDSDDFIEKRHLELMVKDIEKSDLSIIGYTDIGVKTGNWIFGEDKIIEKKELIELILTDYSVSSVPWNKLYKKYIIDEGNIKFINNIKYGEDLVFNIEYALLTKRAHIVNKATYNYVHHATNATGKIYNENKLNIRLTDLEALKISLFLLPLDCLKSQGYLIQRIAKSGSYYYQISSNLKLSKRKRQQIKLNIDPYIYIYLFKEDIHKKEIRETTLIILNRYFPIISNLIYKIFNKSL